MEKKKNVQLGGILFAGIIVLASAVVVMNMQPTVKSNPIYEVKNFNSYGEMNSFLHDSFSNVASYNSYAAAPMRSEEFSMVSLDNGAGKAAPDGGLSVDYSQTNVQVTGVDEPDIVKTDGTYLYLVSGSSVIIVQATPAQDAQILTRISLNTSFTIRNIFISGTRLVVFAETYNYPILYEYNLKQGGDMAPNWYSSPDTYINIYDVSEITSPVLQKDVVVGGYFSSARLIGDYIYVITTQYTYDYGTSNENQTIIPRLLVDGELIDVPVADIYYVDIPEKSSTLTNIISVNIHDDTEDVHEKIFFLGTSQTLYVSQNNIYVTYSTWYYDYAQLEQLIEELLYPSLPSFIRSQLDLVKTLNLNDYQKQSVAQWILQNYTQSMPKEEKDPIIREIVRQTERTIIHRLSVNNGEVTYEGQGNIPGYVNNQFSLSEDNEYLRVSTTTQGTIASYYLGSIESQNNVYVLDMDLNVVGSVENIASGEQIYATRFIGDTCYLVTFKQIDPFFVIDLTDPVNPMVIGEVKIPGYSTYLHPYDETHIIGLGRGGSDVKISLFDVSDMQNPVEMWNYTIESNETEWSWTQSTALYEHKAFLFSKEKNLLVIPAGLYSKESAYVFDITLAAGFTLKGIVSHDVQTNDENNTEKPYYYYDYGNSIQRSLYINDVLYTISTNMVKLNDLTTLAELSSVTLI